MQIYDIFFLHKILEQKYTLFAKANSYSKNEPDWSCQPVLKSTRYLPAWAIIRVLQLVAAH
jgi:hypothetical protein